MICINSYNQDMKKHSLCLQINEKKIQSKKS